ncbi:MAG: aminoacyl-tRNA hydrolase [Planctomycetes bacterium]|nr:aminoacyl-tRNA hydrolase [Planctomycetota bacterium]
MKLVVGLGNPGKEYDDTRHNLGFVVLDHLARRYTSGAVARSKFHAATLDARIDDQKVILLKPTTYMNHSGLAVSEAVRFYKLEVEKDLLIIVDDIALPCGIIRLRPDGGAGGHNGLSDIEQKLGTDAYGRLRIGIDKPGCIPQKDYILGKLSPEQRDLVEAVFDEAVDAAVCWVSRGMTETMNQFNRKNTEERETPSGASR